MVQLFPLATAAAAIILAQGAFAHPGEKHSHAKVRRELDERAAYGSHIARSLEKCARSSSAQALEARAIKRRAATVERLRKRAHLPAAKAKRDATALSSWEKVNHNETGTYTSASGPSTLFGSNTSCVLTPEDVVGPYYVLGELIRSNVTESQRGVPVHLDMQFVDVSTCDAVPSSSPLYVDIWHANATGVYSGVSAAGEGGLATDFLRGVQATDGEGVVQFDTIFPGHYDGRATHLHVTTHLNSTVLANNTYSGGTVTHIGQLFFDETLRAAVEAVQPYAANTQSITSNDDDMWAPDQASTEYDPFPKYMYLGDSIDDGLVMWISIGVDLTANHTDDATPAAYWGANGGYDSSDSAGGGSGGAPSGSGPSGNTTFSGTMPSGSGAPPGFSGAMSGSGVPASGSAGASAVQTGSVVVTSSAADGSSKSGSSATAGSSSSVKASAATGSSAASAKTAASSSAKLASQSSQVLSSASRAPSSSAGAGAGRPSSSSPLASSHLLSLSVKATSPAASASSAAARQGGSSSAHQGSSSVAPAQQSAGLGGSCGGGMQGGAGNGNGNGNGNGAPRGSSGFATLPSSAPGHSTSRR